MASGTQCTGPRLACSVPICVALCKCTALAAAMHSVPQRHAMRCDAMHACIYAPRKPLRCSGLQFLKSCALVPARCTITTIRMFPVCFLQRNTNSSSGQHKIIPSHQCTTYDILHHSTSHTPRMYHSKVKAGRALHERGAYDCTGVSSSSAHIRSVSVYCNCQTPVGWQAHEYRLCLTHALLALP